MGQILKADVEDVFGDVDGFLPFMYSPPIVAVMRHGGYIAGGFPRYVLANRGVTKEYFGPDVLGDVDVFFRNNDDFLAACEELKRYSHAGGMRSMAGFAMDFHVVKRLPFPEPGMIRMQLVNSHFGEPEELIKRFDMRNSMVGFDMERGYIVDGWKELEAKKTIEVSRLTDNAEMLGRRVGKYIEKYRYRHLTPETSKHIVDWFVKYRDYVHTCASREDPRPWVEIKRIKPIIEASDIPVELLPMFAGISKTEVKTPPAFYGGHVQTKWIDSALFALDMRNAPAHLRAMAEDVILGKRAKELEAEKKRLEQEAVLLRAQLKSLRSSSISDIEELIKKVPRVPNDEPWMIDKNGPSPWRPAPWRIALNDPNYPKWEDIYERLKKIKVKMSTHTAPGDIMSIAFGGDDD